MNTCDPFAFKNYLRNLVVPVPGRPLNKQMQNKNSFLVEFALFFSLFCNVYILILYIIIIILGFLLLIVIIYFFSFSDLFSSCNNFY